MEITFCKRRNCCPTIKLEGDVYKIGEGTNEVILSKSQYRDLQFYMRWEPFIKFFRWLRCF